MHGVLPLATARERTFYLNILFGICMCYDALLYHLYFARIPWPPQETTQNETLVSIIFNALWFLLIKYCTVYVYN